MPTGWTPVTEQSSTAGWTPVANDPRADRSVPGYLRLPPEQEAPKQPGALEQIGHSASNQAKGLFDLVSTIWNPDKVDQILGGMSDNLSQNWDKAKSLYEKGDYTGALQHAGNAIPVFGQLAQQVSTNIAEGRPYEAATDVLLAPLLGKTLGEVGKAAKGAPGAAVRAAVKAAVPEVGSGVLKIATGAVADQMGVPGHISTAMGAYKGVPDIVNGLKAGFNAGKDAAQKFTAAQELDALLSARGPRQPMTAPPSTVPNLLRRPDVAPPPAEPGMLPSGRKPGGIQNQRSSTVDATAKAIDPLDAMSAELGFKKPYAQLSDGQQLQVRLGMKAAEQSKAKMSTPSPEIPNLLVRPEAAPQQPPIPLHPTASTELPPNIIWDPKRGHIDTNTGKAPISEVKTIPFSREMPPSSEFADMERGVRTVRVEKIARALVDAGYDASEFADVTTNVRKAAALRDIAKAAGVDDLPRDLTATARDLQAKVSELKKGKK